MKTKHIFLLLALLVMIGIVVSLSVKTDKYSDFQQAGKSRAESFTIIGTLDTTCAIQVLESGKGFTFVMIDKKGVPGKVLFQDAIPQDFRRSTEVVVTGKMTDSLFLAQNILLKCPSKYNDQNKPSQFQPKAFQGKNAR
jgi:cytochrome c-type biogenesis protein CcmE